MTRPGFQAKQESAAKKGANKKGRLSAGLFCFEAGSVIS
jgi:hypothetical protein